MTDAPPRKSLRYAISDGLDIASKPVAIYVGSDEQELYVHENLLCASSEFFQKLSKKSGQERIVKLPQVKADIFKIWMQWLYTGRIFLTKEDDLSDSNSRTRSTEWPRWADCYALGDFLQDHDFKDACVDVCIEAMCSAVKLPKVLPEVFYTHSPEGSAHRQLAIDTFAMCLHRREFEWYTSGLPDAFIRDVLLFIAPRLAEGLEQQSIDVYLESVEGCKYHVHGPDAPCYSTKSAFRF